MATSINVRLSDELEEKLKSTVEEVKKKTPLGAEVNNSTIVRGALEDFIKKIENEEKGIKTVSYNFSELENEEKELEVLRDLLKDMSNALGDVKNSDKGTAKYLLSMVLSQIQLHYLQEKTKFL
ncbi:hypothetical protein CDLVIII_0253 [Clostridium sp. DL-VIII]|uniref:hypothetical protein n=1 Tax=Clostridium sp. DL-VIII TaxID=641107 RepID=UPI00023AF0E2|nr:hypothetical protein [Clostridium sp. DL-VIII]EHI96991.1 hypothetical protein CDLVIII_0253 [Clostridium sp. DL-VIII]